MEGFASSVCAGHKMTSLQSFRGTDAAPLQAPQIARRPHRCSRLVTKMSQQAAPAQLAVKNFEGVESGSQTLTLKVAEPAKAKGLVHRHVISILQNKRQGSANTKTRAEVSGGGRKPFAQKGTGNARQGSSRTPLKPGGGVIFGPKPKDWSIRMNKKERRLATATALQSAASALTVVDDFKAKIKEIKTKTLVNTISSLGIDLDKEHVLLIVDELTNELNRSGRNVRNLKFNESGALNTYDILRADRIVIDKASLAYINDFYGAKTA